MYENVVLLRICRYLYNSMKQIPVEKRIQKNMHRLKLLVLYKHCNNRIGSISSVFFMFFLLCLKQQQFMYVKVCMLFSHTHANTHLYNCTLINVGCYATYSVDNLNASTLPWKSVGMHQQI